MQVHLGKTNYMILGNKNRHNDPLDFALQVDGTFIDRVA